MPWKTQFGMFHNGYHICLPQRCSAVPSFVFNGVEGTVLECLPSELLNDTRYDQDSDILFIMKTVPDKRLGYLKAEYRSASGTYRIAISVS